ncbi:MAG: aminomethyl-transferring glycine dehydrogenase subunit GcvPB [Acidimicrobiales bacterium]
MTPSSSSPGGTASSPGGTASSPGGTASSAPLLGRASEPTLFELSSPGRSAWQLPTSGVPEVALKDLVPAEHLRAQPPELPQVSERDLVAHFTRLSHRQFSVDLGAYPLGSCTMKYNPKFCDEMAGLPGFGAVHPAAPASCAQGWLGLMVELEGVLCAITGMDAVSLQPAAGAAGELTGLLMMKAWHSARGDTRRRVVIPDSAHGTNPASVRLAGFEVVSLPSDQRGCVDLEALRAEVGSDTAGVMLTNPNTLGLFEEDIEEIARIAHDAGSLLYYDGANLNAILGVARPGDMGFDVVHLNLHKTFATPHGGGGPGAGPVAVSARLAPYLPGPRPVEIGQGASGPMFGWSTPERSIGRVHSWHGNALVLARALAYILVNGGDGLRRVAEMAVLNANWLRKRLEGTYDIPYDRPCMHELVLSVAALKRKSGLRALDVAKRLLEEGFHAPTVAFPLIVEEALMIEPTETESLQTLEALAGALARIATQTGEEASLAPRSTPVRRVDEARAARQLVPVEELPAERSGA